jgi:alpha-beta hydrolase superfamily lysophospholipase
MALIRSFITRSIAGIILVASTFAFAQTSTTAVLKSEYSPMDGLKMYYEIHGTGEPLILLHGGLGSSDMFSEIMPLLSKKKQVIAVDLQAHGRTADINRPLSYEAIADDVAALIHSLKVKKADVMGYSVGAKLPCAPPFSIPKW